MLCQDVLRPREPVANPLDTMLVAAGLPKDLGRSMLSALRPSTIFNKYYFKIISKVAARVAQVNLPFRKELEL